MTVAKEQEGSAGVLLKILFGKNNQGFLILALEGFFRFNVLRKDIAQCISDFTLFGNKKCVTVLCHGNPAMLHTTGLGPTKTKLHTKVGRKYVAEEPLA